MKKAGKKKYGGKSAYLQHADRLARILANAIWFETMEEENRCSIYLKWHRREM